MYFFRLLTFFKTILSRPLSECQTVWIQIKTSVLIWVRTFCKGCRETKNAAASRQRHVLEIQVIASSKQQKKFSFTCLFRISISARSSDFGTTVAVAKAAREGPDNPTHPRKIVRPITLHAHKAIKITCACTFNKRLNACGSILRCATVSYIGQSYRKSESLWNAKYE